jgi:hypothetical protein
MFVCWIIQAEGHRNQRKDAAESNSLRVMWNEDKLKGRAMTLAMTSKYLLPTNDTPMTPQQPKLPSLAHYRYCTIRDGDSGPGTKSQKLDSRKSSHDGIGWIWLDHHMITWMTQAGFPFWVILILTVNFLVNLVVA